MKKSYKIVAETPERKVPLWQHRNRGRIILKHTKKLRVWYVSSGLEQSLLASSCECGDEHLGSIKGRKFNYLSSY
jgi:hypothetical protein